MLFQSTLWEGKKYHLDKMTLEELVRAYFSYPAIQVYLVLGVGAAGLAIFWTDRVWPVLASMAVIPVLYALVWYFLHRFVLHGRFLYRNANTAALWKRVHFDHHQDPHNLAVLFGALKTTLPTIFVVTFPMGWLIGGPAGATAAFATGMVTTCFYEFCHCIQHLAYTPKSRTLRRWKKLHLAHHFHNENGNFGITSFLWDRLSGTYYPTTEGIPRSSTVFNLGYSGQEIERYPWVAELTGAFKGSP